MKIAVIGATGLVGFTMKQVLEERKLPVEEFIAVASERSRGLSVHFHGKTCPVLLPEEALERRPDIALFSAGASVSGEWAPRFAAAGTVVIDNSSRWRMEEGIPLIVPEVNGDVLKEHDRIIANPNCSTIQMVLVLDPLHRKFGLRHVVVSTYQAVSGSGTKGVRQLREEREQSGDYRYYPHRIDANCIPQIDVFLENGYTREEMKMVNETRKILRAPELQVSATCVRVPVWSGHSESVYAEFETGFEIGEVLSLLQQSKGIVVADDPSNSVYPMAVDAAGKDDVFVGRIRRDLSNPKALHCWIVSDNLRKGAATNAVQIAEYLLHAGMVRRKPVEQARG